MVATETTSLLPQNAVSFIWQEGEFQLCCKATTHRVTRGVRPPWAGTEGASGRGHGDLHGAWQAGQEVRTETQQDEEMGDLGQLWSHGGWAGDGHRGEGGRAHTGNSSTMAESIPRMA